MGWSMILGDILRSPKKKERKQMLSLPSGSTQSIKQYKIQAHEVTKSPHVCTYLGYVW